MSNFESVRQIAARLVEERRARQAAYRAAVREAMTGADDIELMLLFNEHDRDFLEQCGITDL